MTEDEAKSKACCGPRAGVQYFPATSQLTANPQANCIASACMAWRWTITAEMIPHLQDMWRESASAEQQKREPAESIETDGYCGLAGQP